MIKKTTSILSCLLLTLAFALALPSGADAARETQQASLRKAIQQFEVLQKDKKRAMRRDSWESLESRFEAIEKRGKTLAPEARFYRARSREELADRSKNIKDYTEAVNIYAGLVKDYPKHALADNACYNQALLLYGPMKSPDRAVKALDKILKDYPKGDMAGQARFLKNKIRQDGKGGSGKAQGSSTAAAPAPLPAPPPRATDVKHSKAELANQQKLYDNAMQEWRALNEKGNQKANQRDPWMKLESKFQQALFAAPEGPKAPGAAFQMARCREELGDRSKRRADWEKAVELYDFMAQRYPESTLADDAMLNQAQILANKLGRKHDARAVIESQLLAYPKGDMAGKARAMLGALPAPKDGEAELEARKSAQKMALSEPDAPPKASGEQPKASAQASAEGESGSKDVRAPKAGAILRHIAWTGKQGEGFSIVVELAGKAKYKRQTLAGENGHIVRLELLDTKLYSGVRQRIDFKSQRVSALRSSQSGASTVLELDLAQARSYKVTILDKPYRLKIDVSGNKLLAGGEDLGKLPAASKGQTTVAKARRDSTTIVEQLGLSINTVVIDAGHGGKDPGAVGNGLKESTYTVELARMLGARLQKHGIKVMYTRNNNTYIALSDRTAFANNNKADIFVSIHINSSHNKSTRGLETYFLDAARSDAARVVAAKENSVSVSKTSDLQFILSDLTLNSKRAESQELAGMVQRNTLHALRKGGFQIKDNGVRSAPFYVLMGARMPAFLIEVGYLSNTSDAKMLKNKKYMERLADGIADGILAYKKKVHSSRR